MSYVKLDHFRKQKYLRAVLMQQIPNQFRYWLFISSKHTISTEMQIPVRKVMLRQDEVGSNPGASKSIFSLSVLIGTIHLAVKFVD